MTKMTKYIVCGPDDGRSYREIEATSVVRAAEIAHAELISQTFANQSSATEKHAALDARDWVVTEAHRGGPLRDGDIRLYVTTQLVGETPKATHYTRM